MLGFERRADTRLSPDNRWVVVAPPVGECALLPARAATPEQVQSIGRQAAGRVFLFLHTDDFAQDDAAMRARGVHFAEAPRDEAYGIVVAFEDPFGNRWDLVEPRNG